MEQMVDSADQTSATSKGDATPRWWGLAGLVAIVSIGAAVRFYELGTESYWYDEIIMARLTQMRWPDLLSLMVETGRPPLYVILAKGWTDIFGASEMAGRSLSAVLGTLSIPMMYATGKALFNREVGLISAFICALSGFQVYYSQEFRYYSLVMLLSLVTFYAFIRALQTGRTAYLILFGLGGLMLFYTHLLAVVALAAPGLYFLLRWRRYKSLRVRWLLTHVGMGLGMLPWLLPELEHQIRALVGTSSRQFGAGTWIPVPPIYAPVRTVLNFLILGRRYLIVPVLAAGVVILLVGIAVYVLSRGPGRWWDGTRALVKGIPAYIKEKDDALLLTAMWLVVPIAIIFVGSLMLSPFYVDRYMITAASGMYLLVAVAITYFRRAVPQALVMLVLAAWMGSVLYSYYQADVKEQWREAAAYLTEAREPGDDLAFSSEHSTLHSLYTVRDNFFWYYGGERSECVVEIAGDVEVTTGQITECSPGGGRIWVVMWNDIPNPVGLEQEFDHGEVEGVSLLDTEKFYGVTVFLFNVRN